MAEKRVKNKRPIHISDIVHSVLRSCRKDSDDEMTRIWELWDAAVGKAIAENTRPDAFKGGMLLVNVSSSPWVHQLQFLKQEMMDKINQAFEKEMVREMRFRVGPI